MKKFHIKNLLIIRGKLRLEVEDLGIDVGEITVLQGPNGSGKTTLLRSLVGLLIPERGFVKVDDKIVFKKYDRIEINLPPEERDIGYLPQNIYAFPHMTVYKNIIYSIKTRKRRIDDEKIRRVAEELIELAGLRGEEDKYPNQLSGGQRQRLALAMVLASSPKTLLLDEPFSHIDPEFRQELRREIKALIKRFNIPTLIVSHLHEDLEIADHVYHIRNGGVYKKIL